MKLKQNLKSQKGFTLIELMITIFAVFVVGVIVCYGVLYTVLIAGNFWCETASVEKQLKFENHQIAEVVAINRGVWSASRVLAKTKEGDNVTFCLDSNILFNYTVVDCPKGDPY